MFDVTYDARLRKFLKFIAIFVYLLSWHSDMHMYVGRVNVWILTQVFLFKNSMPMENDRREPTSGGGTPHTKYHI